jgi:Thrombospondin type 3 repeat
MKKFSSLFCVFSVALFFSASFVSAQTVPPQSEQFAYSVSLPAFSGVQPAPHWYTSPWKYGGMIGVWDETASQWIARSIGSSGTVLNAPVLQGVWINGSDVTAAYVKDPSAPFTGPLASKGTTTIKIKFDKAYPASSFVYGYPEGAELPDRIGMNARVDGTMKQVAYPEQLQNNVGHFPRVNSAEWEIVFIHSKPLFVSLPSVPSLDVVQEYIIGFMHEPKHAYRIFLAGNRLPYEYATLPAPQWPGQPSIAQPFSEAVSNPQFVAVDSDSDGISDVEDNCAQNYNPDQKDEDSNRVGDMCDDVDGDSVPNVRDNCPYVYNADQTDTDQDTVGNACDHSDDRLGEKYPWLAWAGIAFAAISLITFAGLQYLEIQKTS